MVEATSRRRVGWFSAGAASAVACLIGKPDVICYCETGSEDEDNARFIEDCEKAFDWNVVRLRSDEFSDTWEVWETRKYISGIKGAPCTGFMKVAPRVAFQRPDDIHIFGYTVEERKRIKTFQEMFFDMTMEFPLVDADLTKSSCLSMVEQLGVKLPRVYAMGYEHANCIPCPKATSPAYWALVRKTHPEQFHRMVELSRRLNVRLCWIKGVRSFIDEIPEDHPVSNATVPSCDFMCAMTLNDM